MKSCRNQPTNQRTHPVAKRVGNDFLVAGEAEAVNNIAPAGGRVDTSRNERLQQRVLGLHRHRHFDELNDVLALEEPPTGPALSDSLIIHS
jgi:hypothetical protein